MNISDKTFLSVISLSVAVAILSTAYIFLIRKDYKFVIEAPCDPALDTCFSRDCSGGECPPNEYEEYRIFTIHARDFEMCSDSTCLKECVSGTLSCAETVCGESEEDVCAVTYD